MAFLGFPHLFLFHDFSNVFFFIHTHPAFVVVGRVALCVYVRVLVGGKCEQTVMLSSCFAGGLKFLVLLCPTKFSIKDTSIADGCVLASPHDP